MARTRAQSRALSGSAASTASRPRYRESEDDSSDEPESAGEGSGDEYRPRAISRRTRFAVAERSEDGDEIRASQTPSLIQVLEQNFTFPRRRLRVINHGNSFSPSSDQEIIISQASESTDADQTTAHRDISLEEAVPQEMPSNERFFFEDQLEFGPPSYRDLLQLEFFQTFPHDPAATLCRLHFLQLVESWYRRRQGHTENMIYELSQEFRYSAVETLLNFTRDREILAQVMWDEPWRKMPYGEFKNNLELRLHWAEVRLREQRRKAIAETGIPPKCELENCGALACGYCLALMNDEVNLYEVVRVARARTWHGAWQDGDAAAFEEHQRKRMDALDLGNGREGGRERKEIDMGSAYVSVGGLHIVVDVCNGETMIRFQGTRAALVEGRQNWRLGGQPLDVHFYDRAGVFDLDGCSANKDNCACTEALLEQ